MEVSIAALLLGAGYMMSRPPASAKDEQKQKQQQQRAVAGPSLPGQQDVYENTYFKDTVQRDEILRAGKMAGAAAHEGADTGIVSPNERRLGRGNRQRGPEHDQNQVYHGQQRQTAAASIVSPLTGRSLDIESFTTQGMVPFYGGSVKQPTVEQSDASYGGKLEAHTGAFSSRPWGAKEATTPHFKPSSQGMMTSAGHATITGGDDQERSTFLPSVQRTNELPPGMSREMVGKPGILGQESDNIQYDSLQAAMDRGMVPTIDTMRTAGRQQETFGGRTITGNAIQAPQGAHFDVLPEVAPMRRGGPVIREIKTEDDMLRTTGAVSKDRPRPPDYKNIRVTNRQMTTATSSYYGSAGSKNTAVGQEQRSETLSKEAAPQLPAPPVGAATLYAVKKGRDDYGRSTIQVYGNNRDVTTVQAPSANLSSVFKALTMNTDDVAKTTRKQMISENEAPIGNLRGGAHRTMTYFDPETGIARTSLKELMVNEAPLMGPDALGSRGGIVYDPEEWRPAPTLKQLITDRGTGHTDGYIGGAVNATAGKINDFTAPTTQREVSEATRGTSYGGVDGPNDGDGYKIAQATTNLGNTHRETTSDHDHTGQARGGATSQVSYDAAKVMRHDAGHETTLFGRSPTAQGSKQFPDAEKIGGATVDGRQLASDAASSSAIPAAPRASAVPPSLMTDDLSIRTGLGARSPPHDDEKIDSMQSDDRLVSSISSSTLQRGNNPYVLPPLAGGL